LLAPAKVNLHLEVLRRRADGFHDVETVMQAVDLKDRLQVTLSGACRGGDPEIEVLVRPNGRVPEDRTNLCWQAAEHFCHRFGVSGQIQIELDKEIPVGAGLGGGSSDAMAVLVACDHLFATGLDRRELAELGSDLGSDVPFFASGGTQLGRGTGTELTALPHLNRVHFLILKPSFSVDTESAYDALKMGLTVRTPAANLQVIKPLLARFPGRPWFGFNRLEDVVLPAHPELSRLLLKLREFTPVAMMSGSGSAVFRHRDTGEDLGKKLKDNADELLAGTQVHRIYFSPDGANAIFDTSVNEIHYLVKVELNLTPDEMQKVRAAGRRPSTLEPPADAPAERVAAAVPLTELQALEGGAGKAMTVKDVARWFTDSVVVIRGDDASGSGFVVGSKVYILTCAHCVLDQGELTGGVRIDSRHSGSLATGDGQGSGMDTEWNGNRSEAVT